MTQNNISHTTHFVRGFAQSKDFDEFTDPKNCQGNFIAVITDLQTTFGIDVKAAYQHTDTTWTIVCLDDSILILAPEPSNYRELFCGGVVTKSKLDGKLKIIVPKKYDIVAQAISNGDRTFRLIGFMQGEHIITSPLRKLWTDSDGKHHALTISHSHYIF